MRGKLRFTILKRHFKNYHFKRINPKLNLNKIHLFNVNNINRKLNFNFSNFI